MASNPAPANKFKTPCKFGHRCNKPDCPFGHSNEHQLGPTNDNLAGNRQRTAAAINSNKLCRNDAVPGGCTRPNCHFKHENKVVQSSDGQVISSTAMVTDSKPMKAKTGAHFATGKSTILCRFDSSFDGCKNSSCPFKHERKNTESNAQQKIDIEKEMRNLRISAMEHNDRRLQSFFDQVQNDTDVKSVRVVNDKIEEALIQQAILFQRYEDTENLARSVTSPSELLKLKTILEQETRQWKADLPIYSKKGEILKIISEYRVTILTAETGSGKSTQLVQYLAQHMATTDQNSNKLIVCTQPRKIAVVSLAKRVAEEMGEKDVGGIVGYKAGAKKVCTKGTKILFCTDTTLLMDMLADRQLKQYAYVIVDEAHERSLNTDVLLGMLKRCLAERQDIKVIITSATIDPTLFLRYFAQFDCKIMKVAGKVFPVDVIWAPPPPDEDYRSGYLDRIVNRVNDICDNDDGDILAFLTNADEIQQAEKKLRYIRAVRNDVEVLPLHGRLSPEEQQRVYQDLPGNKRKLVFATNCAETSITIPGIRHVVDCGLVKERQFDQIRGTSMLKVCPISQSSANQRKGRAGRTAAGVCHRLYEQEDFEEMKPSFVPEILRVNLSQALLTLLQHNIDDIINFDFIEKPERTALTKALNSLKHLGAVTESNKLTPLGQKMAQMTLEPRYSKFVVESFESNQQQGILSLILAACATVGNLFFRSGSDEQKNKADMQKMAFCLEDGDSISNVNLYLQWHRLTNEKEKNVWCSAHFVNAKSMRAARDVFNESKGVLTRQLKIQIDERNMPDQITQEMSFVLRHLMLKCFDDNLARYSGSPQAGYYNPCLNEYLHIHPSSALASCGQHPDWIVFDYAMETSRKFMFNVTSVYELLFEECGIAQDNLEKCKSAVLNVSDLEIGLKMKSTLSKNIIRREVQETIRQVIQTPCIIEPQSNDPLFRVKIYAMGTHMATAKRMIDEKLKDIRARLEAETIENPTSKRSSMRAITGIGGETLALLLPEEFISIKLLNVSSQKDAESMKRELEYCNIRPSTLQKHFISPSQPSKVWGTATFVTPQEAKAAFDILQRRNEIRALPIKATGGFAGRTAKNSSVSLTLSWCRRSPKNFGYVNLKDATQRDLVVYALSHISHLTGWNARAVNDKNKLDTVLIQGVSAKSDTEFQQAIDACLAMNQLAGSYKSVPMLGRQEKFETKPETLKDLKQALQQEIQAKWSLGPNESTLTLREPSAQAVDYMAYFNVPVQTNEDSVQLIDRLTSKTIFMNNQLIKVEASYAIHIGAAVYEAVKDELQKIVEELKNSFQNQNLRCDFKPWKQVVQAKIFATTGSAIAEAKRRIEELADGVTLDCKNFPILFSPLGADFLKNCSSTGNILAKTYTHKRQVILYGSKADINRCIQKIQAFEQERSDQNQNLREISLQGPNRPRGLIKQVLQNYNHNIENLQHVIGLDDCKVLKMNFARRSLHFGGTQEGYEFLLGLIESCVVALNQSAAELHEGPQCPICLMPVDSDGFCLENCGHYYCQACISDLVKSAVESKTFPISCATENCGRLVTMADFKALKENNALVIENLVAASVDCYFTKHTNEYLRCSTPDCDGIFRKSTSGQLSSAQCSICNATLCSSCGEKEHRTILSCRASAESKKSDEQMSQWLMEDQANRKSCPKCNTWIEKNGGCKHVHCRCGAHFCWQCKRAFPTGEEVYRHLGSNMPCGAIF